MYQFPSWIKLLKGWKPFHCPSSVGGWLKWNVYRDTSRTRRLAGYLEFAAADGNPGNVPENVLVVIVKEFGKCKRIPEERLLTLLSKETADLGMPADKLAFILVDSGCLGRWVRLHSDEKSVHSVEYGPMSMLKQLLSKQHQQLMDDHYRWLTDRYARMKRITLFLENNKNDIMETTKGGNTLIALKGITEYIGVKLQEIKENNPGARIVFHPGFPWQYSFVKPGSRFRLGIDFLLALAECLRELPEGFEWKEIGARFSPSIGGSKQFDTARDELIQAAELICGVSLDRLGLTSLGSLYPLYILGDLKLAMGDKCLAYPPDTICALSNIQVDRVREATTGAGRVILTENRALLLKMEAAGWQLQCPESLIIGIDGYIRLAHSRLLKMLAAARPEKAFFAWVDTDQAGIDIARNINDILPGCLFVLAHQPKTITALKYLEWLRHVMENPEIRDREQEGLLGNPGDWDSVFRHPMLP